MTEYVKRAVSGVIGLGLFLTLYIFSTLGFTIFLGLLLLQILVFEWPKLAYNWYWKALTPFYPVAPVIMLAYLNYNYRSNLVIPLYPFLIAWIADTFSFFVGKLIGKNKICPSISPKKTWEGLIGGVSFVFIANLFFKKYIPLPSNYLILFSIIIAVMGFLGDIFVSYLKRKVKLKDTGAIIPGHGGVLDRFDSVFFIVIVYLCYLVYNIG